MKLISQILQRYFTGILLLLLVTTMASCSSPEERAKSYYKQGNEYLAAGDYTKAGLEYRNAIELDEKLADAWLGLATVAEHEQNLQILHTALQKVVELDTANVDARMKLARLLLGAGESDKALELANAANELKKNDTDVLALRAAVLLRLNDREGARANAEQSLSLDPDNPDAHAVLAADQLIDNHLDAAMQFVDRGLTAHENNLGLLLLKLKILELQKDDAKFESVMRRLIVIYPENTGFRRGLVAFLVNRKRIDDAETEMRAGVATEPANHQAALELVRFIGAQRGPQAGRKELEKLIADAPDVADFKLAMAQLDFAESKPQAAATVLDAIIAESGSAADIRRAQLLLARNFLKERNAEQASTLIETVLSADAKNVDALALRGTLRLDAGSIDKAIADIREALNQAPQSVALMQLLAKAYERQGSISLADDQYGQAWKAANYAPAAALVFAEALRNRGNLKRAEDVLTQSAARYPDNIGLLTTLGQVRLNLGDWIGAQDVAETLKTLGDQSGVGAQILAGALFGQKKFDESIAMFKSNYETAPQAVRPMYSLMLAYIQAGRTAEAKKFLDSVLEANPDNAEAYVLQGSLYMGANEPEKAEAALHAAIDKQPGKSIGYMALASYYAEQKKFDEAESVARTGLDEVSRDFGLQLALAGFLETKGDYEGAIKEYEAMLKAWPDSLIVINNIASLVTDHRSDKESLERANQLVVRIANVDVPQFKDTIGWIAFRRGDNSAALENLRTAVEKLPGFALAHYHLGMTYAALGNKDEARQEFNKAAELLPDGDPLRQQISQAIADLDKPATTQN